jgi:hypothetical protein
MGSGSYVRQVQQNGGATAAAIAPQTFAQSAPEIGSIRN